jgi:hypothetical protein
MKYDKSFNILIYFLHLVYYYSLFSKHCIIHLPVEREKLSSLERKKHLPRLQRDESASFSLQRENLP